MSGPSEEPEAEPSEPERATGDEPEKGEKGRKKKRKKKRKGARAASGPDEKRAKGKKDDAEPSEPHRPRSGGPGRRPRSELIRGGVLTGVGFLATFLMMANEEQLPLGPLWGMITTLVGTAGVLDLLGLWTEGGEGRISIRDTALFPEEGEPTWMSPIATLPAAFAVLVLGALIGGYHGLPITIVLATVVLLLSAIRRPFLMVVCVASFLFLPFLGVYGLWDPWETHYGEVSREILARDDWISLWWAQEDWFWSKPILIFWMEALSMGAFGVDFLPDANPAHPEWAVRFPHFLLVLGALSALYGLVSTRWSKRTGLVVCVVLCTMPHFFFLAHQAITDMPFVANMTMAICMLGLAVTSDDDAKVRRWEVGPLTVSARHAVIGGLTLIVVPQILYLFSRNITFLTDFPPFGWHGDIFLSGSAGNHGIPGNSPVHNAEPFISGPGAQPITQGLLWLCAYLGLLFIYRREERAQSLAMFAFYIFCGLAFMAKGIPGFALPGLVALFWLIASRRWELLGSGKLRVGAGILTVLTVGLPWYVAMYIRHGPPFTDRLLIHDHINRLTAGVHGDTGSIEYFIEQMGYGLFPWIAMAPIALAAWFGMRPTEVSPKSPEQTRQRQILLMIALWLASAFTLFSAMTTKFHHYIFPTVPPAAVLVGLAVERLLRPAEQKLDPKRLAGTGLALLAPVPAVLGVAGLWGDVRGIIPAGLEGDTSDWVLEHPWSPALAFGAIGLGVLLFIGATYLMGLERRGEGRRTVWAKGALTTGLLAGPPVLALVGRDMSWVTDARPQGYERLIHLFVYNYGRPWPEALDYRPILTGFAVIATCAVLLAAVRPIRDVAIRALIGVALAFCLWSLDVYMIDLSPHWGQRELVQTYYEERASDEEPLIAWQMNWKGENFYTGNRVHVFVQLDNRALREWLGRNPGRTAFFMLEHSRLNNLRGILRGSEIEELTDERLCNKFVLIRVHLAAGGAEARPPGQPG